MSNQKLNHKSEKDLEDELNNIDSKIIILTDQKNDNERKMKELEDNLKSIEELINDLKKDIKDVNDSKIDKIQLENLAPFPRTSLPKIGSLFEEQNKRYLVIKFWEELELAKEEAQRLKAILCINSSDAYKTQSTQYNHQNQNVW
ncbi:MAG: hypothetical protein KC550_07835 [Nanoarchaeota archaeon]|nr:hypothetical protein [Nanoarchaeota archaeon]MCB1144026.1 hypothetical protein [Leptospiraceae bacterium]MCP5513373.1 hypothetical protein [Leptospiraceae bacterium]